MAWFVHTRSIAFQLIVAIVFYVIYSYCWFGPVQELIGGLHNRLQEFTRLKPTRIKAMLDNGNSSSYLNYQLLKHCFRLSWFFLANYFYHYRLEEKKRVELAVANKELQIKLLKWHLNPSFYFKTIEHLGKIASEKPLNCAGPILQLARVMEYVIYEVKENLIDVKKEINFLTNYLTLLNEQPGSKTKINLIVIGSFDHLKIAPLLLTGLIDKIDVAKKEGHISDYNFELHFSGNQLVIRLKNESTNNFGNIFSMEDAVFIRLNEIYKERFTFSVDKIENQLLLNVQLDEG